jgi:hypothetical protein
MLKEYVSMERLLLEKDDLFFQVNVLINFSDYGFRQIGCWYKFIGILLPKSP